MRLFLHSRIAIKAKYALYKLIGLSPAAARRLDLYLSRRAYRRAYGAEPNLASPVLYGEKITVRKLFDQRPIFRQLADKLQMRELVARKLGETYLPQLLAVHERFDDIDFDRLPDKFVIKPNHGTHWILVVEDKRTFDRSAARATVEGWMKTNYYVNSREVFYRDVKPKIMIEECLEEASGAPVIDYKFWVFDGVVRLIAVAWRESTTANRQAAMFDRDGTLLPVQIEFTNSTFRKGQPVASPATAEASAASAMLPANIATLMAIAEKVGDGFDFIRVDLYSPAGRILVGELTSLPGGGVRPYEPIEFERLFGSFWKQVLS